MKQQCKKFSVTLSFCRKHTQDSSNFTFSLKSSSEKPERNHRNSSINFNKLVKSLCSFLLTYRVEVFTLFFGRCPAWLSNLLIEIIVYLFSSIFLL